MKHGSDWYKREPLAYLGGVQGMTTRQHAVYSVTLDLIYAHGGSVNNDPGWIAGWIKDMGAAAVRNAISELFEKKKLFIDGDQIFQKRAKTEAKTKEKLRENAQKSGKKGGEKSAELRSISNKYSNLDEPPAKIENQTEKRREEKTDSGDDADTGDHSHHLSPIPPPIPMTEREQILSTIGVDPVSGMSGPNGTALGQMGDMQEFKRWRDDLNLDLPEVLLVIGEVMTRKAGGPPKTFSYFTAAMQRFAGERAKPKLQPIEVPHNAANAEIRHGRPGTGTAGRAHDSLTAAFARTLSG